MSASIHRLTMRGLKKEIMKFALEQIEDAEELKKELIKEEEGD